MYIKYIYLVLMAYLVIVLSSELVVTAEQPGFPRVLVILHLMELVILGICTWGMEAFVTKRGPNASDLVVHVPQDV
jgi:hypothetical protein